MNQPDFQNDSLDDKAVKTITIPAETYKDLIAAQNFLEALQGCGVDNWEGYDMAQEMVSGD